MNNSLMPSKQYPLPNIRSTSSNLNWSGTPQRPVRSGALMIHYLFRPVQSDNGQQRFKDRIWYSKSSSNLFSTILLGRIFPCITSVGATQLWCPIISAGTLTWTLTKGMSKEWKILIGILTRVSEMRLFQNSLLSQQSARHARRDW